MNRFFVLICAASLIGCQTKIAYSEFQSSANLPDLKIAAIGSDDKALPLQSFSNFGADGPVTAVLMSPSELYVGVNHREDGIVVEDRIYVFDAKSANVLAFATDNNIENDINAFCGPVVAVPFAATIPAEIAAGNMSPTTTGAEVYFVDTSTNSIQFQRWLSNDMLYLRGEISLGLRFIDPVAGDNDTGFFGSRQLHMEFALQSSGSWEVQACDVVEPVTPPFTTTRDVTLGAAATNGQVIEINGNALLDINNQVLTPLGATHVDGPYQ